MMKRAIGCEYICARVGRISTPAIAIDMFTGMEVPREQPGGSVDLLVGTDWLEYMPMPVERVYSMQLWQSVLSTRRLLCGDVPSVYEWEEYKTAAERFRHNQGLAGPPPRNVHPQLMRPG